MTLRYWGPHLSSRKPLERGSLMKRENLPSIVNFIHKLIAAPRLRGYILQGLEGEEVSDPLLDKE